MTHFMVYNTFIVVGTLYFRRYFCHVLCIKVVAMKPVMIVNPKLALKQ